MRREQPPCLMLALQAPLGRFPHYKYSVALTCVLFLSNKAPAAASELHGLRRKPTKRSSRAPHTGSGTRHVGGADSKEVLVQHAETGGLLPAAPGRGGTFWAPTPPKLSVWVMEMALVSPLMIWIRLRDAPWHMWWPHQMCSQLTTLRALTCVRQDTSVPHCPLPA